LNHILWLLCYYYCLSIYLVWYLVMLMEHAHREHVELSLTPHLPSPLGKWWSTSRSWCTPLSVMGTPTYLVCVDLLTPFLHHLEVWWLASFPLVDVMHTYSRVCWTPCCCYACLPRACMPPWPPILPSS
jgi:hypothetical protein